MSYYNQAVSDIRGSRMWEEACNDLKERGSKFYCVTAADEEGNSVWTHIAIDKNPVESRGELTSLMNRLYYDCYRQSSDTPLGVTWYELDSTDDLIPMNMYNFTGK